MSFVCWARIFLGLLLFLPCFGSEPNGKWSPLNADLLFTSNRDGGSDIFLKPAGSNKVINLTNSPSQENWAEWSPDGSQILFQSSRSGNRDIWIMNADGSNQRALTTDPAHDFLPGWSPDGTQVIFLSLRREPGEQSSIAHVYLMDADGSKQHRFFTDSIASSGSVSWSQDGQFFVMDQSFSGGSAVILRGQGGKVLKNLSDDLTRHNGAPVFSPDGKRIAFYSDAKTDAHLVVMNSDGSGMKKYLMSGHNLFPRWSPDGKWLTFTGTKTPNSKDFDIFALSLENPIAPIPLISDPTRDTESRWRMK